MFSATRDLYISPLPLSMCSAGQWDGAPWDLVTNAEAQAPLPNSGSALLRDPPVICVRAGV